MTEEFEIQYKYVIRDAKGEVSETGDITGEGLCERYTTVRDTAKELEGHVTYLARTATNQYEVPSGIDFRIKEAS